jgi:succinyl-diaminopimelate desuccinylase
LELSLNFSPRYARRVVLLSAQIRKAVAGYRREMAELTKELVRLPTENPPGQNYRACAELLARRMRELGLPAKTEKIPPPKSLATDHASKPKGEARYWVRATYGSGRPALYFHGHYDVVPASSAAQFQPREKNGCIFGRGSGDMKGGLAAMIYAVRALMDLKIRLRGRIEIVCVPDEETGGAQGTAALFEHGLIDRRAIGMLTPEPTSGVIWNASRGAVTMRAKVKGKPAHVGLSFRGVNAFEKMLEVAHALEKEKRRISRRKTRYHIAPDAARRSILLIGGRAEGGTNFNVVPAECSFTVDRRINPEENLAAEKKHLLQILDRMRRNGIALETEMIQLGDSAGLPQTHALPQALAAAASEITHRACAFEMCPGLLETRFYAAHGVPALAYGPGLLSVAHGPNEFVSLRAMESCAAIYALAAARLLGEEANL